MDANSSRITGLTQLIARNRLVQFIAYVAIGGSVAVLGIVLLYVFTEVLGIWYLASAAMMYVITWIVHYTLNKTITFQNRSRRIARQFSVFVSIGLISLAANLALLSLFVEVLNIGYLYAQAIVIIILFGLNYLAHRFITFGLVK